MRARGPHPRPSPRLARATGTSPRARGTNTTGTAALLHLPGPGHASGQGPHTRIYLGRLAQYFAFRAQGHASGPGPRFAAPLRSRSPTGRASAVYHASPAWAFCILLILRFSWPGNSTREFPWYYFSSFRYIAKHGIPRGNSCFGIFPFCAWGVWATCRAVRIPKGYCPRGSARM